MYAVETSVEAQNNEIHTVPSQPFSVQANNIRNNMVEMRSHVERVEKHAKQCV